jgi:hypothetical protein
VSTLGKQISQVCLAASYGVTIVSRQLHSNQEEEIMAQTSAEKQQRYRERHLGVHGAKQRIQLFISVQTKAQLGRLARHYSYTITKVVEDLVRDADRAILDRLPRRQHAAYLDSHQRVATRSKAKSAKKSAGSRPARRRKVTV